MAEANIEKRIVDRRLPDDLAEHTDSDDTDNWEKDKEEFPEGGRGWLVIFGTFLMMFITYGLINAFGIYQSLYETEFPDARPSVISLVGSLQPTVLYLVSPIVGPMADVMGIRYCLLIASVIMVVAFMLMSISTKLWHLFLTQGVLYGLGAGIAFFTAMSLPSEWFKRKRSIVFGITSCGATLGSVVWPFALQGLVKKIGLAWANRVIGFMYIPLSALAIWGAKSRLPREKRKSIWPKWSVLKDWRYVTISIAYGIAMFGLFAPLFYITTYADRLGVRKNIADNILTILNACTLIGRTIPLQLADMLGRLNVLIPCMFFIGILPLVLWLPANSEGLLITFAALFGAATGSCSASFPPTLGQLFGMNDNESRLMIFYLISVPGSFAGSSIASALIPAHSDTTEGFDSLIIFCSVIFLATTTMLLILRLTYSTKLKVFI